METTDNQQGRVVYVCPECGETVESIPPLAVVRGHHHTAHEGVRFFAAVPTRVYTKEEIRERLLDDDAQSAAGLALFASDEVEDEMNALRAATRAALTAAFPTPDEQNPEGGS
jgi:hypothetical protein